MACVAVPGEAAAKKKAKEEAAPPVFYPAPPDPPRVQFLKSFSTENDLKKRKKSRFKSLVFGDTQTVVGVVRPFGVTMHDGQIFVCDPDAAHVVIFDLKRKAIRFMGDGTLRVPLNIAIDSNGNRYVTDSGLKRIIVFDSKDRVIRGLGDPEKITPTDVGILADELYVADVDHARIVVMDKLSGETRREIGARGMGEGLFMHLTSVLVDPDGYYYASDSGNAYVQKFDSRDNFVRQIGEPGDLPGQFARPKGMALDAERRLYVVDAAYNNVQIFNEDGELLMYFGGEIARSGSLILPAQVAVDYDHIDLFKEYVAPGHEIECLILVSSQYGPTKINVYGLLKQQED